MVSVIVPNFNHHRFLKQRIESILNQTYSDIELIILDDKSTDGSAEFIQSYAGNDKVKSILINNENSGFPIKQWLKGISLAKGEYIWIAESDDYCSTFFLEKVINVIESSELEIGMVYCQTIDVDENGHKLKDRIHYTSNFNPNLWECDFCMNGYEFLSVYLMHKNVIPNASAVVFKKFLLDRVSDLEKLSEMRMAGDWFFWIKISQITNVAFVSDRLNYFRYHDAVTRNHSSKNKLLIRFKEEKVIRNYLSDNFMLNQSKEWNIMLNKWFEANDIFSVFSFSFYELKPINVNVFLYVFNFINFLLKREVNRNKSLVLT